MFGIRGVNVFLFVIFYSILPIIYLTSRNDWKAKKNIMLGVTLPKQIRESEEVARVGRLYRKELDRSCLILAVTGLPALFIRSVSISLTWDLIWMVLVMIMPSIVYIRGWRRLKKIKTESCGEDAGTVKQEVYVDMSAVLERQKEPSLFWYLVPAGLSLLPCLLYLNDWGAKSFWWMEAVYLSMAAGIFLLVWVSKRGFRHQKVDMVDTRTELTVALTRVRYYNWHKMMLWTVWLTGSFSLILYFFLDNGMVLLAASAIYTMALLGLALHTEFTVRHVQERLTKDCGEDSFEDDDRYWLLGCLYYNPKDKHVLKNARTGMNMTVNLATGAGKVFYLFTAVVILLLPFLGFWMIAEEFTPIRVTLSEQTLVASHLKKEYTINLEDILSVEVIDELPSTGKDVGSAFDTLYKGQFRVDGYGVCELFLNPQDQEFVVIDTEDERYIFTMEDELLDSVLAAVQDGR